jgi:hypothetical protein
MGQTPFITGQEEKKLPRGASEELFSKDQDVVMVLWHDSKVVFIRDTANVERWIKKSKEFAAVNRPAKSTTIMVWRGGGSVDLLDQLISYNRIFYK